MPAGNFYTRLIPRKCVELTMTKPSFGRWRERIGRHMFFSDNFSKTLAKKCLISGMCGRAGLHVLFCCARPRPRPRRPRSCAVRTSLAAASRPLATKTPPPLEINQNQAILVKKSVKISCFINSLVNFSLINKLPFHEVVKGSTFLFMTWLGKAL